MKIGKAKYSNDKKQLKIEEKDTDYAFRILPPMGKCADAGQWYAYYRVEWGYKGSDGRMKPFLDVRKKNYKTNMVEVESAAHLKREQLKQNLLDAVERFKSGSGSKQDVTRAKELKDRYNLDAKFYLNAVSLNGTIGLLKLNKTQMDLLKVEIKKLQNKGIDPLSVDKGVFFVFSKSNDTGNIKDWSFKVGTYLEESDDGSMRRVYHNLDEEFVNRLSREAFELSGMYPTLTPEQVEEIVSAGEDHAEVVDRILGTPVARTTTATTTSDDDDDEDLEVPFDCTEEETVVDKTVPMVEVKTTEKPKVEAKVTETPKVVEKPKVEAKVEDDIDPEVLKKQQNDDFLKSIGAL